MEAFRLVFKDRTYLALGIGISVITFALATWLPNFRLLWLIWSDASIALTDKIILPIRLLTSIATNFTTLTASYTILIAIVAGMNISFATYLLRTRVLTGGGTTTGLAGLFSGAFGIGCAACGSLIVASLIGTAAGAGLLALLPLRGSEFGILGVALLGCSTYLLAKQIAKPLVC